MDTKVDRNEYKIIAEEVHLLSPSFHRRMATRHDLWVEKRVETVNTWKAVSRSSFHQEIHVEIDHLAINNYLKSLINYCNKTNTKSSFIRRRLHKP